MTAARSERSDPTGAGLGGNRVGSLFGVGHLVLLATLLVAAVLSVPRDDPFGLFFWPFVMLPPPLVLAVALFVWRRTGSAVGVAGADALVICLFGVDFLTLPPAPFDESLLMAWRTVVVLSVAGAALGFVASAWLVRKQGRGLTPSALGVVAAVAIAEALFAVTLLLAMKSSLDSCTEGYCGLVIPILGIPIAVTLVVTLVWLLGSHWPLIVFNALMFLFGLGSNWSAGPYGLAWLAATLFGFVGGVLLVTRSRWSAGAAPSSA